MGLALPQQLPNRLYGPALIAVKGGDAEPKLLADQARRRKAQVAQFQQAVTYTALRMVLWQRFVADGEVQSPSAECAPEPRQGTFPPLEVDSAT